MLSTESCPFFAQPVEEFADVVCVTVTQSMLTRATIATFAVVASNRLYAPHGFPQWSTNPSRHKHLRVSALHRPVQPECFCRRLWIDQDVVVARTDQIHIATEQLLRLSQCLPNHLVLHDLFDDGVPTHFSSCTYEFSVLCWRQVPCVLKLTLSYPVLQ